MEEVGEALQLRREVLGERHPDTLQGLNNLAGLYFSQGHYSDAEPLLEEALQLRRETLGKKHSNQRIGMRVIEKA
ncbi:MAG: tetratricopeptide repeat protein [Geminicoccaceae bacterium]